MCKSTVTSLVIYTFEVKQLYWKEGPFLSFNSFTFTQNMIVVSVSFLLDGKEFSKKTKQPNKQTLHKQKEWGEENVWDVLHGPKGVRFLYVQVVTLVNGSQLTWHADHLAGHLVQHWLESVDEWRQFFLHWARHCLVLAGDLTEEKAGDQTRSQQSN